MCTHALSHFSLCIPAPSAVDANWTGDYLCTLQFAEYCEKIDLSMARDVFSRACSVHLSKKPSMHLAWAAFEERQGQINIVVVYCIAVMFGGGKIWRIVCGLSNFNQQNFSLSMVFFWLKSIHSPNFFTNFFYLVICQALTISNISGIR